MIPKPKKEILDNKDKRITIDTTNYKKRILTKRDSSISIQLNLREDKY
jgi:hypothetical protein